MKSNKILIVIPARYASTRLPGKPLVKIAGKEMIKRVAEIAAYVSDRNESCGYIVATDDERIVDFCKLNNIPVTMTSETCKSGTERCWDAVQKTGETPELIINLQGDNPLCPSWFIDEMIKCWKEDKQAQVFTPCVHLSWEEYDRMKEAKKTTPYSGTTVLIDKYGYALAFSKMTIPAVRKEEKLREVLEKSPVRRHIGLYAYTYDALKGYFDEEPSPYELPEGLEQMRFLHNRIPVKMVEVDYRGRKSMSGVDSPEDVERAEKIIAEYGEFDLIQTK
ncbi:3-deoxy-manno-octulosonate cytidylyltransferase [Paludibacter sp. 221]|uniref:3-deoxy-manno-octulosonate cytidylyltransferase n=1 Tax=Paludibacter sp. 221 TaxID=2302939 RepID=UPI0013D40240|nr:3-deoxy-manno-octulosonate cytidylyltransferase [Paludibacter sp. 221]NDV47204.1 3-deoxy-manno-octulosonate cytidylyltransferase [Paludibacter sp. 221]